MSNSLSKLYQNLIDYGVMERHCKVAKKALEAELNDLESTIAKDIEGSDEYFQDAYFRNVNDFYIETTETLPRLQWYAQFLTTYAYFEQSLNDVCCLIRSEYCYSLSLKDLYGQGILRAKNYFVKVASISKSFSVSEWQQAKLLAEVRNAIAHRNGFVEYQPEDPKSVYSRISNLGNIELRQEVMDQQGAQIFFTEELVLKSIDVFKSITLRIANEIKEKR